LEEGFKRVRRNSKELVEILKVIGSVDSGTLLWPSIPRIPIRLKTLSRQLEDLEAYGMVEPTPRGWRLI
jgi:DNA-binding HxlR family transcriptional regulator